MRNALVLVLIGFFTILPLMAQEGNDDTISKQRIQRLTQIINRCYNTNRDQDLDMLVAQVRRNFLATEEVFSGTIKPLLEDEDSLATAAKRLHADADEKYPNWDTPELERRAKERYPMYKVGEQITIVYKDGPRKTAKITGVLTRYNGTAYISINNSRNIRLADMAGITGNDGEDGELAKLDKAYNQQLRENWIATTRVENAKGNEAYRKDKQAEYERRQREEDFATNQRNGYIYSEDVWHTPEDMVVIYCERAYNAEQQHRAALARQQLDQRVNNVESQLVMTLHSAPAGTFPSAEKLLAERAERERQRKLALEQQRREEELKKEREAAEARKKELERKRAEELANKKKLDALRRQQAEDEARARNKMLEYGAYGLLGLLVAVCGALWFLRQREKELDVSKFFEGKGKLQKEFWDAANADPDNFKYVAYLFPDMNAAKEALEQLSFMTIAADGGVIPRRNDIRYGAYPHQGRAVAFIGGQALNYARWREASMVWPELPSAGYFKVSSEPHVRVILPNVDNAESKLENLGVEDVRTETGEINRIFRFRCSDKSQALEFLNKFQIEEEGIVAIIETDDGECGKDINGIFGA